MATNTFDIFIKKKSGNLLYYYFYIYIIFINASHEKTKISWYCTNLALEESFVCQI